MPRLSKKPVAKTAASSRAARNRAPKPAATKIITTKTKTKRGRAAKTGVRKVVAKAGRPVKVKAVIKQQTSTRGRKKATKEIKTTSKRPKNPPPSEMVYNDELKTTREEWVVDKIIQSRMLKPGKREYLVKWKGYPTSRNSWEPEVNVHNCFDLITEFDKKFPDAP